MGKRFKAVVNRYILGEMYSRYNRGGFLIGDIVSLKKDFKSDNQYKELPDDVKNQFESYAKEYEGNYLKVVQVRTHQQNPNSPYAEDRPITMVDVMFDIGIGTLHGGPFMVPTSILEVNEDQLDGRMPKVPEHFYRAEPSVKPEPVSKDVVNDGIVNQVPADMTEKPKRLGSKKKK